eukprot:6188135-Pleurochrysis_carterae.AAC.3
MSARTVNRSDRQRRCRKDWRLPRAEPAVDEFIQYRIARRHNSHAIETQAMAERGGVPVHRLAVGVRSHLAAAIADRA